MGLCSRCTALYGAFFSGGICLFFFRNKFKVYYWKIGLILFVPLFIDVITQLIGLRESNNTLRLITGAICGLAFALIIVPPALELCLDDYKIQL